MPNCSLPTASPVFEEANRAKGHPVASAFPLVAMGPRPSVRAHRLRRWTAVAAAALALAANGVGSAGLAAGSWTPSLTPRTFGPSGFFPVPSGGTALPPRVTSISSSLPPTGAHCSPAVQPPSPCSSAEQPRPRTGPTGTWTDLSSGMAPPASAGASMVYDAGLGTLLLVDQGTTWKYTPVGWEQIAVALQPPPRTGASLAFDGNSSEAILYGGVAPSSNPYALSPLNDTWVFANGSWTRVGGTGPPASLGATMTYDSTDGYVVLSNGLGHPGTWIFSHDRWANVSSTSGPAPAARYGAAFVDDPRDGYAVLFGGTTNPSGNGCPGCPGVVEFNDTWAFKAGLWRNFTARSLADYPARDQMAAAFDATDGMVIATGGYDSSRGGVGATHPWSYSGGQWSSVPTQGGTGTPCAAYGAAMAYDDAVDRLVQWGGVDGGLNPCTETVSYADGDWTPVPALTFPSRPSGEMLTFDPADGYVLLFGAGYAGKNETWTFQGGIWTQIFPGVVPPGRGSGSLAYDAADGYVVLFGGYSTTYHELNDTWSFRAGVWTNLTNLSRPAPPARDSAAMGYDSGDGYLLLFGGFRSIAFDLSAWNDTWSFHGGSWTERTPAGSNPGIRSGAVLADDPSDGYVVLFGGTWGCDGWCSGWVYYNDTWTYHAGTWTNRSTLTAPPFRADEMLAEDPGSGDLVLFGGDAYGSAWGDTWSYHGGSWSELQVTIAPPADSTDAFASDLADGYIVVLPNWWSPDQDTWIFQEGPYRAAPVVTPGYGPAPLTSVFNATVTGGTGPYSANWTFGDGGRASGLPVVHTFPVPGVYVARANVSDVRGNWTAAATYVASEPNLTANVSEWPVSDPSSRQFVFSGSAGGGTAPYSFRWTFGDGSNASEGAVVVHSFSGPGVYRAVLTVSDGRNSTARAAAEIDLAPPPLSASVTAAPFQGDSPLATNFTAVIQGGVPPYSYTWSFGDGSGSGVPSPSHVFAAAGSYPVQLMVADVDGSWTSSTLVVEVYATPSLAATVTPDSGVGPLTVEFTAAVRGGLGPMAFEWSFGDGSAAPVANATHTYGRAGTYLASVEVTDVFGTTETQGPFAIAVAPAPPPIRVSLSAEPVPAWLGSPIQLSAEVTGGVGPYTYDWSGLPVGCAAPAQSAGLCRPASVGTDRVTVVVRDSWNDSANASTVLVVQPRTVSVNVTIEPMPAVEGSTVSLTATPAGGIPPYEISWGGLPSGCSTQSGALVQCTPSSGGVYSIHVVALDSANESGATNATLFVEGAATGTTSSLIVASGLVALGAGTGAVLLGVVMWIMRHRRQRR